MYHPNSSSASAFWASFLPALNCSTLGGFEAVLENIKEETDRCMARLDTLPLHTTYSLAKALKDTRAL